MIDLRPVVSVAAGKPRLYRMGSADEFWASRGLRVRRRHKTKEGYVRVTFTCGGTYTEHRAIVSEILGRGLKPGEHVHHINRRRDDNRPANLALIERREHVRIHAGHSGKSRVERRRIKREIQLDAIQHMPLSAMLDRIVELIDGKAA